MNGRHRVLAIAWMVTIATILIAFVVLPVLVGVLYYVTVVLAILTYRRAEKTQHDLPRIGWYRAIFGSLLVLSAVAFVAGGSSFVIDPRSGTEYFSLGLLSGMNVLVAIVTWRALVDPQPKRAALAGGLATIGEMLALIGDALIAWQTHRTPLATGTWSVRITVIAAMIATIVGMLGCVFALTLFRRTELPEARKV